MGVNVLLGGRNHPIIIMIVIDYKGVGFIRGKIFFHKHTPSSLFISCRQALDGALWTRALKGLTYTQKNVLVYSNHEKLVDCLL